FDAVGFGNDLEPPFHFGWRWSEAEADFTGFASFIQCERCGGGFDFPTLRCIEPDFAGLLCGKGAYLQADFAWRTEREDKVIGCEIDRNRWLDDDGADDL